MTNWTDVDKRAKAIIDDVEYLNEHHQNSPDGAITLRRGRTYIRHKGLWQYHPTQKEEEE